MRPDHKSISAFCRNSNTEERGETIRIQADVDVVWTDIRDRGIGQDVMLLVECDISPFIRSKDPSSSSSELEQQVPEVLGGSFNDKMEFSRVSAKLLQPLVLDFAFEHDLGTVETTSSGPRSLKLHFTATDLPIHLEEAMEHVSIAACLSPVFYEDSRENDEISGLRRHLIRWIEWREHMRKLGVERVNWYGRSEDMKDFVDVYNDVRGTKDIFR